MQAVLKAQINKTDRNDARASGAGPSATLGHVRVESEMRQITDILLWAERSAARGAGEARF